MKKITIRSFNWDDLEEYNKLISIINEQPLADSKNDIQNLKRSISGPWQFPERDIFFAAVDDNLVGFISLILEKGTGRAIASGGVDPKFRRQKIGTTLLEHAISHSYNLGQSWFQMDIPENLKHSMAFCKSHRFEHVRTHTHLSLGNSINLSYSLNAEYKIRHMMESDIEGLTQVQNLAFAGTWGFQENTSEEVKYRITQRHLPPPDHVDIVESLDGEIVGYCWSEHGLSGEPGAIGMVGINPKIQGKGLGRAITAAGLKWLINSKANPINITVDSENLPAVNLYKSLGFEPKWESYWFQKDIRLRN